MRDLHPRLRQHLIDAGIDEASPPDDEAWERLLTVLDDACIETDDRWFGGLEMLGEQATPTVDRERTHARFIANMSHELRTPLNAILGYSQMLLEEISDDELCSDVRKIDRAGRRLLRMINDILDISRIDAGRLRLERQPVDLVELLTEAVALSRKRAEAGGNVLTLAPLPADLGPVLADQERLQQCVVNLLSNAAKFTENGSITVSISLSGTQVDLTVADTGIGMSLEEQAIVFGDFTQGDGSSTRRFGGTGLGLALTRRIVELMGGAVMLRSEPGHGSTFVIRMTHMGRTPMPVRRSADPLTTRVDPSDRVVVLIDDDPDVRELAERFLAQDGWVVLAAPDGPSGMSLVRRADPDIVLLDLMLPGPSGWTILEELRADAALRQIPVIILSTIDDRSRGLESGAVEYLVKPIDRETLLQAVRSHAATPSVTPR